MSPIGGITKSQNADSPNNEMWRSQKHGIFPISRDNKGQNGEATNHKPQWITSTHPRTHKRLSRQFQTEWTTDEAKKTEKEGGRGKREKRNTAKKRSTIAADLLDRRWQDLMAKSKIMSWTCLSSYAVVYAWRVLHKATYFRRRVQKS